MVGNSTVNSWQLFSIDPTAHYREISAGFSTCHLDPVNVALHFVTTPLGMIGAFSLLYSYTRSSSVAFLITSVYLLSLLPAVPNGVFIGTAFLCGLIVFLAKQWKLNLPMALLMVVCGYLIQDLAHMATGEETFQASYSDGGQIDLNKPIFWLFSFLEHCYYLLPLCVHVALPFVSDYLPTPMKPLMEAPLPDQMQRLHAFAWLLGPLVCCALGNYCVDSKNQFCFFPGTPFFHRVVQCNLLDSGAQEREVGITGKVEDMEGTDCDPLLAPTGVAHHSPKDKAMTTIRNWAMAHNPPDTQSSHWWYTDLEGKTRKAFDQIAYSSQVGCMFRELFSTKNYYVDVITGMNEIYISGPSRFDEAANSDNVFYTRHVDGPFGLLPFVSVYRCIVGLDRNEKITTHFPLAGVDKNACTGDVLGFDFNREVHYISCDESKAEISDKFRVVLKLHYCVYPRVLAPLGWLMYYCNVNYNMSFRALFLKTINPATLYEHFLAWNVNVNTILFDRIETLLGQRNLVYLIFMLALWWVTGIYEIFFAFTSYVHYFRYISTYYVRKGIDFGSFKRDVLLFKSVALAQLFYHYCFPVAQPFQFDPISILMIVGGYTVSVMATNAIGIDRTYFGAELGLCEPKWIDQFPYGYIPHPMIVSQVVALLGFYKAAHYRTDWPYVVPIHVLMYLTHMMQEHFDVYQKDGAPTPIATGSKSKTA